MKLSKEYVKEKLNTLPKNLYKEIYIKNKYFVYKKYTLNYYYDKYLDNHVITYNHKNDVHDILWIDENDVFDTLINTVLTDITILSITQKI